MKYATLHLLGAIGIASAGCSPQSLVGCRTDNDCAGTRACDPASQVCAEPRPPASVDLSAPSDMASQAPDLAVPPTGAFILAKRLGGAGTDQAYAIATDRAGGFTATGTFQGTVDFGGGPLTSRGGNDVFVVRYGSDGALQWSRAFGGAGDDLAYGVAVDGSGAVAIAGAFTDSAGYGGEALRSAGGYDIFVARYASDGKHLWSARAGGTGDDAASGIAVDGQGDLAVAGYFSGTAGFGPAMLVSAGDLDAFVARLSVAGVVQGARGYGGGGQDFANRVAIDGQGNAVVAGYFHGSASFGGDVLSSAGGSDIFVARYSAAGAHGWSRRFGGATDDSAASLALDGAGNVVIFGLSLGAADLGGGVLQGPEPYGLLLAKYSAAGAHLWSKRFGASAPARAGSVALEPGGSVFIAGSFNDQVALGGEALTRGGVYVARLSPGGAHLWSRRSGGTGNADALGVATDPTGNVLVAGDFADTMDFGGGPLQSAGDYDAFVLKLAP